MFLATLVDMPCIMEAQKTLDFRTFFKSTDVSQMLYIHNRSMDDFHTRSVDEVFEFAKAFKNVGPEAGDADFFHNVYRRSEISSAVAAKKASGEDLGKNP